jgi:hypothetical protein
MSRGTRGARRAVALVRGARAGTLAIALGVALAAGAAAIAPTAAAAQDVVWESELPRVMVFLQEEGGTAASLLTTFLADAGFDVIDPAFATTVAQREQAARALGGDAAAATALGRDMGAQVLVIGAAPAEAGPSPSDASLQVATANLQVRALRLDRPGVISSAQASGRALDATGQAARTKALEEAARTLLFETAFLGDVVTDWEENGWDDRAYWSEDGPTQPTRSSGSGEAVAAPVASPGSGLRLAVVESEVTDRGTRGIGVSSAAPTEGEARSMPGTVRVRGIISADAATVTVAGQPAEVRPATPEERERYALEEGEAVFEAEVGLSPGETTLPITARSGGEEAGLVIRPQVAKQWAVVIGISEYADKRIAALRFADDDARAVHDFLRSETGGAIPDDRIRLLLDEEATAEAIREALFVFLQQAAPEDQVLLYVASHGAPDPNRPANLYILPYDTDIEAIAATAFPMWDVKTALRRHIDAERVAVIADACHSGGALAEGVSPIGGAFGDLFDASRRVTLSAADATEQSIEGEEWGGGHGVFTYVLMEGLRGEADLDGDGEVTFTEVATYVEDRVPTLSDGFQHPQRSGRGDLTLSRP